MDETAQRKIVIKPVEDIGSEGGVMAAPTAPEGMPWGEILGDDDETQPVQALPADASNRSEASQPERFPEALSSASALEEKGLLWAEIVPDDLAYMSQPDRCDVSFLSAQAGGVGAESPPWAEILDEDTKDPRNPSATQHIPQALSGAEQEAEGLPYEWYHELTPIPVPIMPIALFQLVLFVLFW